MGDPTPGAGPNPAKWRRLVLRLVVTVLLLFLVLLVLGVRAPLAIDPLNAALALAVTFPLMMTAVLLAGWRLAVLAGRDVRIMDGIAINSVAQLVALIVPSRLSEAAKPAGLQLRNGIPFVRGLAILAIERIMDAAFLAGMALLAMTALGGSYRGSLQSSGKALAIFAVIGVLIVGTLAARPAILHVLARRFPSSWLGRQVDHVAAAVSGVANHRAAVLAVALSAGSWLASYLIFVAFFEIMGIHILSMSQVLVVFVASTLGLVVSVAPGGLGTFEAAIALTLTAFGIPTPTAVALAILLRICLVLPVVSMAGWTLSEGGLSLSDVLNRLRGARDE